MSGDRFLKYGKANSTYTVLALDEDLNVTDCDTPSIGVDQLVGETLEVWKEREDGFLFVYCNRLELGYWVIPHHITVN